MLNLFVSIVVLGMIAFILFWFFKKPQEDAKRAQYPQKIATCSHYF